MNINLFEDILIPKSLTGFSGSTTMTVRSIKLLVLVRGVMKIVKFSVVDHPKIYNHGNAKDKIHEGYSVSFFWCQISISKQNKMILCFQKQSLLCFLAEPNLRKAVSPPTTNTKHTKVSITQHTAEDFQKTTK